MGGSLTTVFAEKGLQVFTYDKNPHLRAKGGRCVMDTTVGKKVVGDNLNLKGVEQFAEACDQLPGFSGIYFVCVPTPMKPDGFADLTIVNSVLDELAKEGAGRIAVIKSTIPPGFTGFWNTHHGDKLHVIFNPEFLTEANALDDMRNQSRIVLGGPRPWINQVRNIYQTCFPNVPIIKTSSTTAEMVKYVTNIHLAAKVSLANEFYQVCQALDDKGFDIDYDKVIEYAVYDERLGKSHWKVPGPMPANDTGEPAFGFGGSCVVAGTKIRLSNDEEMTIDEYHNKWHSELKSSPNIVSCDQGIKTLESKSASNVTRRRYIGPVYRFVVGEREITTTPEHIFPVLRGDQVVLVRADEISIHDTMFVCK